MSAWAAYAIVGGWLLAGAVCFYVDDRWGSPWFRRVGVALGALPFVALAVAVVVVGVAELLTLA